MNYLRFSLKVLRLIYFIKFSDMNVLIIIYFYHVCKISISRHIDIYLYQSMLIAYAYLLHILSISNCFLFMPLCLSISINVTLYKVYLSFYLCLWLYFQIIPSRYYSLSMYILHIYYICYVYPFMTLSLSL